MGEYIVGGRRFKSEGEHPNATELQAAVNSVKAEQAKTAPEPAPFDVLEHQAASAPYEDAPSAAAINLGKAHGMTEYTSPIEAGKDFVRGIYDPERGWFKGSPALSDVGKIPGATYGSVIAPLSTSDPHKRQRIYARQIPGAKPVSDKFGRPMIELPDGKRYYMEGGDLDVARAGLGVSGGVAAAAALPVSSTLGLIGSGAAYGGAQSIAEDVIAGSAAGDKPENWVDLEKAGWNTVLGAILPAAISKVPAVVGRLNELVKRGVPLTDEALARAGLTAEQIMSLTGDLRDQLTTVARRTFGNPNASGAAYRQSLSDEFKVPLTRGELSGDAPQIAREQTLSVSSEAPGRARAAQTIQANRTKQDEALTLAQRTVLRGGQPRTPDEAGTILKGGYEAADAQAKAATDALYGAARDPEAVVAAGGKLAVPASHASQLGQTARAALEADDVGRIVLSEEAGKLTPNARAALAAVDRWSQRALGPRVDKRVVYSPEGLLTEPPAGATSSRFAMDQPGTVTTYPEIGWKQAEDLRQVLIGYQKKAVAAAKTGTGSNHDVDAVEQILQSFDDHLGPLNPLYAPARASHEARMSTFKSGGNVDQDSATKAVLKALEGPEPGVAVTNTIFGANVKKGAQMIDHLNERVFAGSPEARQVIKEQSLRRLVEKPNGDPLTPQQQATAITNAFGNQEGPLYQRLFSGEELARLRRYHELVKTLGESRTKINPPNSGVIVSAVMKSANAANIGTAIGSVPGLLTGSPWLTAGGAAVGRGAGAAIEGVLPPIQAARAVRPPPGPRAAPAPAPGAAGAPPVPGPVDRLWQGLLGGP